MLQWVVRVYMYELRNVALNRQASTDGGGCSQVQCCQAG